MAVDAEVERLIKEMNQASSWEEHEQAANRLIAFGAKAVPALSKFIRECARVSSDESYNHCIRALKILVNIGVAAKPASQDILPLLTSDNARLKHSAIDALDKLNAKLKYAVPVLVEALNKEELLRLKLGIIRLLGKVGLSAQPAVESLTQILNEEVLENPTRRLERYKQLDAQHGVFINKNFFVDRKALDIEIDNNFIRDSGDLIIAIAIAIRHIEPDNQNIIDILIKGLEDKKKPTLFRVKCVKVLGKYRYRAERALPALTQALLDSDKHLRHEIRIAIARIKRSLAKRVI